MAADRVPAKVAARCGCGRPVEPGHRYCPDCGSLVGHLAGESDGVDLGVGSGDPSVLLGSVAGPVRDVASVQTGGWGLGYRLLAIGAAAVVVLLVWGLFRQPSDEVVPDPVEDEEASASDEAGEDAPADGEGEPLGSTTTRPPPTTEVLPGGPLLGEETGLTLVSGSGAGLRLVDLDDGTVIEIDRVFGEPLGVLGSTLILRREAAIYLFDLAEPQAEARSLLGDGDTSEWVNLVDVADGLIWVEVYASGGDHRGVLGYDEQGQLQEQRAVDQFGTFGGTGARLVWTPGGGIYRSEGSGYRRVSTGMLQAVGDELALITECGDALECHTRWVDIATWTDPGHPDPPPAVAEGANTIAGPDRWLVTIDWTSDRVRLVDIATGEVAHEMPARGRSNGESVTVSDDGRWLVDPSAQGSGEAVIVDLDSGAEWPLPERIGSGATVFVDSSLIGSPVADPSIDGEAEGGDG